MADIELVYFSGCPNVESARDNLRAALDATRWKVHGPGGAAELLQIKPTTLASRIKKMGLQKPGD